MRFFSSWSLTEASFGEPFCRGTRWCMPCSSLLFETPEPFAASKASFRAVLDLRPLPCPRSSRQLVSISVSPRFVSRDHTRHEYQRVWIDQPHYRQTQVCIQGHVSRYSIFLLTRSCWEQEHLATRWNEKDGGWGLTWRCSNSWTMVKCDGMRVRSRWLGRVLQLVNFIVERTDRPNMGIMNTPFVRRNWFSVFRVNFTLPLCILCVFEISIHVVVAHTCPVATRSMLLFRCEPAISCIPCGWILGNKNLDLDHSDLALRNARPVHLVSGAVWDLAQHLPHRL